MPLDDLFSTVGGKFTSIGDSVTTTVSSLGDTVGDSFTSFFGLEKREPTVPEENAENNNNVDDVDGLVEIKNDPNNEGEFLIDDELVISGETSEPGQPQDLDFRKGSLADLHYDAQEIPDEEIRRSRSPSVRDYEQSRRSSSVKSAATEEFFPTNVKGEQNVETEPAVRSEDLADVEQGTVGSGSFGSSGGLFDQDDENDTIAMGGEAGEEKPREPPPTVGQLEVAFSYSGEARRMNITIVKVTDIPAKDRGGPGSCRVRLALMPSKRQRAKTRIREGENPEFKELFRFTRLFPHELASTSMRFRLFGTEKMRKEQLIGECVTKFSSLNTNMTTTQTVMIPILARSDTSGTSSPYSSSSDLSHSESNSSLQSMQHGGMPELLVGLSYNSTTGRLSVEILKGSHFKNLAAGRAPDSYVRVSLMSSSGFEMTKSKTSIRRGQPNPTFKETFIFQVAQFQLPDVTLLYTVFNKRAMKRKETLGWFSMGLQNSSEEELAHWNEMRDSKGHQVCRWHALLEP